MKDYKKILEGVVNIINTTEKTDIGFTNICSYIGENCPELKESKDERIRKIVYGWINTMPLSFFDLNALSKEDMFAWLERQGEQKPTDNAEPKFKVGDYVVDNCDDVWRIEGIINQFYILEGIDGGESRLTIEWVNKTSHLWDITEDAKKGDVLVHNGYTFIFMGIENGIVQAYEENLLYGKKTCNFGEPDNDNDYSPATEEQRDLLFQKMKESGYEWNDDKKELKKIEDEEYDGEDYGIDGLWHAKNILEKTLGKVDGYQTDYGILDHKCAISAVDRLYKQKPAEWSEEDESNFQMLIDLIKANKHHATDYEHMKHYKLLSWFKSLKERYVWKPSNEQTDAL